MARTLKLTAGIVLVSTLSAAVWFLGLQEQLRFNPEEDSSRTFILSYQITSPADSYHPSQPEGLEINAVMDARVTAVENHRVQLNLSIPYARIREGYRTRYDSETVLESDWTQHLLKRIMSAGITTWIDAQGRQTSPELVDADALAELADYRSPALVDELKNQISEASRHQLPFPGKALKKGMSWETGPLDAKDPATPPVRYEVSELTPEHITITLSSTSEGQQYHGFVELERKTGWPLRGRILFRTQDADDGRPQALYLSFHQPDHELIAHNQTFLHWADLSLHGYPVNTEDSTWEDFLKPPADLTLKQRVDLLESAMLWFPPDDRFLQAALSIPPETLYESNVVFDQITNLRLVNGEGQKFPLVPPLSWQYGQQLNRYRADWPPFFSFDTKEFSPQELSTFGHLELDADLTLLGDQQSLKVTAQGVVDGQNNSDYQVEVLQWSSDTAKLRISHKDQSPFSGHIDIHVAPHSSSGEVLSAFNFRLSTSRLEELRATYLQGSTGLEDKQSYAVYLMEQLFPGPDSWHNLDRIIEVQAEAGFDHLTLDLIPTFSKRQTLRVQNAATTLQGGPVVGTRTLGDYLLPKMEYPELKLTDIHAEGAEHNQLKLRFPNDSQGRCSAELTKPYEVQGSPLSFQTSGYFQNTDVFLASAHGLRFFYDLAVSLEVQCITHLDIQKESVEESSRLRRIDPYTIELSEALFNDLSRIREGMSSNFDPFPFIGYNRDGKPLVILSHEPEYRGEDAGFDSRRLRFWGEVTEVAYPAISTVDSRQIEVRFPPLP